MARSCPHAQQHTCGDCSAPDPIEETASSVAPKMACAAARRSASGSDTNTMIARRWRRTRPASSGDRASGRCRQRIRSPTRSTKMPRSPSSSRMVMALIGPPPVEADRLQPTACANGLDRTPSEGAPKKYEDMKNCSDRLLNSSYLHISSGRSAVLRGLAQRTATGDARPDHAGKRSFDVGRRSVFQPS